MNIESYLRFNASTDGLIIYVRTNDQMEAWCGYLLDRKERRGPLRRISQRISALKHVM